MSLSPISSSVFQPRDISQYLASQVVLDFHLCERGIDFEDLFDVQLANSASLVEMVFGEEAGAGVPTDAEEALESYLRWTEICAQIWGWELMPSYPHQAALRKVDAEYEHLWLSACLDHCGIDEEPLPCSIRRFKTQELPCYHCFTC